MRNIYLCFFSVSHLPIMCMSLFVCLSIYLSASLWLGRILSVICSSVFLYTPTCALVQIRGPKTGEKNAAS